MIIYRDIAYRHDVCYESYAFGTTQMRRPRLLGGELVVEALVTSTTHSLGISHFFLKTTPLLLQSSLSWEDTVTPVGAP